MFDQITAKLSQALDTARGTYALRKINERLPVRVIYTAPQVNTCHAPQTFWFDIHSIEFDASSMDEQTGEWGVFFCSGYLYFEDHQGKAQTMTRNVPAYTLSVL